jgi:hypothetical protein
VVCSQQVNGRWSNKKLIHHSSFTIHKPYSYGDSAGFTPVFPFNSLREAEKPITGAKLGN